MKMIRPTPAPSHAVRMFLLCLAPALLLASCGGGEANPESLRQAGANGPASADGTSAAPDSGVAQAKPTPRPELSVPATEFPEIRYTRLPISSKGVLDSIRTLYKKTKESDAAFRAITTLNRKEFGYIRVGDTIVTPDTVLADLRAYSVFPARYPAGDTLPKLILISNKYQSYACYEYGHLVRFAACNTGTERKATFPGRYALNWKERMRTSSLNDNWKLPYNWNFHLYAGNAFHQFAMPGRPVSHSCVRQFMPDAEWLFSWGEGGKRDSSGRIMALTGTPVIIIDIFDFTRPKGGPWLELPSNREVITDLPADPMGVEEALIPMSQVPSEVRGGLPNRDRYKYAEDTLRARGIIREGVNLSASINYNKLRDAKAKRASAAKPKPKSEPAAAPTGPASAE